MTKSDREKAEIYQLKMSVAHFFGYRCFLCKAPFTPKNSMAYHHIKYLKRDKKYSDFKSSLFYHRYLIPVIKKNPRRFMMLCSKKHRNHHVPVGRTARWGYENLIRFFYAVLITKSEGKHDTELLLLLKEIVYREKL